MSLVSLGTAAVERISLPDTVTRAGIAMLVGRTARSLARETERMERQGGAAGVEAHDRIFADAMVAYPVAAFADDANAQHYELPPRFFAAVLGPRRKYSSCLYAPGVETLAQAEIAALAETCMHAGLADGQHILELGCGWGSLSLWMAEHFPNAAITAVSNSSPQRKTIEALALAKGLTNLTVVTADMNRFDPAATYDRVVSVEMFEHMSNWLELLTRVRGWLKPDGKLFLHVFSHRSTPYRFDHANRDDWIARHFFTGGLMPSHGLVRCFPDLFRVEEEWNWSGEHYRRTAMAWLANFDGNSADVDAALAETYGADADLWKRRWRLFFLATAGLFGHDGGREWGVSHYRLSPA